MNKRIFELTKLTLKGEMYATPTVTEYDDCNNFFTRRDKESNKVCKYILNQTPVLTKYSKMTGFFNFDGTCVGDAFRRGGHLYWNELMHRSYLKPNDNLSTLEWQHATADYTKVLNIGLCGIINEIDNSLAVHTEAKQIEFLNALKNVANALIKWAHKCSKAAFEFSKNITEKQYKENLEKLSQALLNVPENKPSSFYEAILTIYICFSADPDSIGTLDRYLSPFYFEDIKKGTLTRETAKEYLQELFLMLQAATPLNSKNFTRGGESHFCIGGYLPDGTDGFNELSALILESMLELPTYIPQVSFRWTNKTPKETFRFVLDCERKDPHKRIAFQNDEKRIKCYTEICEFPFEKAVSYTTVGCNEPVFQGSVAGGNSKINFVHSIETLFHKKSKKIIKANSFDEFYNIFIEELCSDLQRAFDYDNKYNLERSEDINYISSIFFQGCINKAESLTKGTADIAVASPMCIGITNVIDSLIITKQFVFDEKIITMQNLINALKANWKGFEDLHTLIINKGDFFGNDTERSNSVAQRLYQSLYEYLKNRKNIFGYQWLIGDLLGYNPHNKWFGENTAATPDGRYNGDSLKFGLGQSEGKDRNGLSALLNSIAKADKNAIACGSTVTNIMLDEKLITNNDYFEKTADMLETYFKNGGVHFQLTYVSKKDLLAAQKEPEKYSGLRVRVTGFSDYFVNLHSSIQEDIIERTTHNG